MKISIYFILFALILSSCGDALIEGKRPELPDFSYAGYEFGMKEIPDHHELPQFPVTDFGALADDGISDREAIQSCIDAAALAGGGVVLFPAGRFLINEEPGQMEGIMIQSDHIILKGAGKGEGGTELFMKEHLVPEDPSMMWTSPPMFHFIADKELTDFGASLVNGAPSGGFELVFDQEPRLKKGDVIRIYIFSKLLNERMLEGRPTREIWKSINEEGVEVVELHQIAEVIGKKVRLYAPLSVDLLEGEPWEIAKFNMLSNCGFEDIHFMGNFLDPYVHHKDARSDSGFKSVQMTRCMHSWIRSCRFSNVSAGAHFKLAMNCVMQDLRTEGNPGHESFNIATSSRCLMAYCGDIAPQWHGPCASHASTGTVIFRFEGINTGIDLHGNCPRNTLFDQCTMAGFDGENVGKTSHGANYLNLPNHLTGLVIWNFKQTANPRPGFNFWDTMADTPEKNYGPLTVVNPIIIGFHGISMSFEKSSVGYTKSMGDEFQPFSLYLDQLAKRGIDPPL